MPKRVSFLVDGFNMYHSLDELQNASGASVKWLDLTALCGKYLHAVRNAVKDKVDIAAVYWFSARPDFMVQKKPDLVARYDTYAKALRESGVQVVLSSFKRKTGRCQHCGKEFTRHEEKETDVALAMKLLETLACNECDTALLVTGDTDLIPAIKLNQKITGRKIGVGFPVFRHNVALEKAADYFFKINQKDIQKSQFPREIKLGTGKLQKPSTW